MMCSIESQLLSVVPIPIEDGFTSILNVAVAFQVALCL